MRNREVKMKPLAASILSLSLLTVMAGAAVAPALEVIRRHFSDANQLEVQLVVCMPALFIVITNMLFGRLASRFGARTLTMAGLALYTVGGAAAGLFNSIWAVLVMRALVGVGVGIIMPLSTGLLTYYFAPEKREGLMGLSSAANQLGGVCRNAFGRRACKYQLEAELSGVPHGAYQHRAVPHLHAKRPNPLG